MKIAAISCIILCAVTILYMVYIYWESKAYKLRADDEDELQGW